MMIKEREIMTSKEVAEYLSIHPLTVHKYAREGKIPAFKIGTDWRFHKKYIERWIRDRVTYNLRDKTKKNSLFD
ncbi:MAG: helix-turn-helix domain-containing protein [Candidatus Omnitrophota bacterium]